MRTWLMAAGLLGTITLTALAATPPVPTDPIDALVASMSLDEKIAQMIMTYPPLDKEQPVSVGAVVLTGNLLKSAEQVRARIDGLQSRATVPLLVAADVEGGSFNRLKFVQGLEALPSAADLGRLDAAEVHAWGRRVGKGMRSLGLNCSLAPVLDVADRGLMFESGRSMGSDPERVGELGRAYAQGLWAEGVIPIGKHFPGYGPMTENSDHHLVVADLSREQIARQAAAFTAAGGDLGGVMLANVGYTSYGSVPAILSPELVGMAHEQGWVTVTDDLAIKSLAEVTGGSQAEVVRRAFLAGNDVLLTTAPIDWEKALDYRGIVRQLVVERPELEARVDESVRRVLAMKQRAGLLDAPVAQQAD